MNNNVTPRPRARILAMRARDTIRIPMPIETVIVPIPEFVDFIALTKVAEARHQRAAVRAKQRAA